MERRVPARAPVSTNIDERWVQEKHPRTAIGIKKGEKPQIVMAVYDGDKNKFGQSIPKFATYLQGAGWDVGLNLDGGGSSEMVCSGNVENLPSYGSERLIATGVMVVPKEETVQERFLEEVIRWLAGQGAGEMTWDALSDSEAMKELVDWQIRNKFHEGLNEENVGLLHRGVFSEEVVEHLNQAIREHLKPDFEQWKTPESQQTAKAADDLAKRVTDEVLPEIINDANGYYARIYRRQEQLIRPVTLFEWDRKIQLSEGTTGTVGMKFFEEVVEPVWKAAGGQPGGRLKDCLELLVAEFSEEQYKVWCFEQRYKERQEVSEIVEAYSAQRQGWPVQLNEKQVRYILKETRDQFFYHLFQWVLNRSGRECDNQRDFKTIVEELKAGDKLLEQLFERYDIIFERGRER